MHCDRRTRAPRSRGEGSSPSPRFGSHPIAFPCRITSPMSASSRGPRAGADGARRRGAHRRIPGSGPSGLTRKPGGTHRATSGGSSMTRVAVIGIGSTAFGDHRSVPTRTLGALAVADAPRTRASRRSNWDVPTPATPSPACWTVRKVIGQLVPASSASAGCRSPGSRTHARARRVPCGGERRHPRR